MAAYCCNADDTLFILSDSAENFPQLIRKTEDTLHEIKSYFNTNGLLLNLNKTQCIFIGSRTLLSRIPTDTVPHAGDTCIKLCESLKISIFSDKHLLLNTHTHNRDDGERLRRSTDDLHRKRKLAMQTLVLGTINNGMMIAHLQRVQKLHNFSAKVAAGGRSRHDHASSILEELKWLNIIKRMQLEHCIFMFIQHSIK